MIEYTMKDVQKAVSLAFEWFGDKIRKGDGTPYIGHLLRVTGAVMEGGGSCRAQIGGALHDVLEDIPDGETLIRDNFGQDMVDLVRECSDTETSPKPPWKERKQAHIDHMQDVSDDALRIVTADKLDNGRSLCVLANYDALGSFNASPADIAWYYHMMSTSLVDLSVDITGLMPQVDELTDIAETLADLVGWSP